MTAPVETPAEPGPPAIREEAAAPSARPRSKGSPGTPESGDTRLLRRVRARLVLWSGGITLVILVVLGVTVYLTTTWSLASTATSRLQDRASRLVEFIANAPDRPFRSGVELPLGLVFGGTASGSVAIVVGPDNSMVSSPDVQLTGIPETGGLAAARAGATDVRTTVLGTTPVRVLSEPVAHGGQTYVVQIIGDRTGEVATLDSLVGVLLLGGLAALALAVFGGSLYAGRALVPIRELMRRQREFAADASHELRTPLAVIRGSVEHLSRHRGETIASVGSALEDIDHEVDHLTELVDELLLLARADSGALELERVPLDLADVTAGALGGLARLAEEHSVRLEFDAAPVGVVGDPTRLRQLVTILADNAIRLSPNGGTVTVRVADERGRATMTVDDEGPGIPPDLRTHVFERFWRAPNAPPGGSGLGLAIAQWIVQRHGGTIAAADAPVGGARFVVSLPAASEV